MLLELVGKGYLFLSQLPWCLPLHPYSFHFNEVNLIENTLIRRLGNHPVTSACNRKLKNSSNREKKNARRSC